MLSCLVTEGSATQVLLTLWYCFDGEIRSSLLLVLVGLKLFLILFNSPTSIIGLITFYCDTQFLVIAKDTCRLFGGVVIFLTLQDLKEIKGLRSDSSSHGSRNSTCYFFLFLLFETISQNQYFYKGYSFLGVVYLNYFIQSIFYQPKNIKRHHFNLFLLGISIGQKCSQKISIKLDLIFELVIKLLISNLGINLSRNKLINFLIYPNQHGTNYSYHHSSTIKYNLIINLMAQRQQNYSLFFYVDNDSCDIFNGLPFDNFSYSQFEEKFFVNDEIHQCSQINQEMVQKEKELHDQVEVSEDDEQAGQVLLEKRANNTIFKTSLSQYRKSLIDCLKGRSPNWILEEIKKIYASKNMSIFPKLNFMVRQLHICQQVTARWILRSQNLVAKKRELVNKGKYSKIRLQELQKSIDAMNFCMSEPLFEVGFQKYWGNYKQSSKFSKSRQEVLNYLNQFKNLLKENSSHAKIQSDISEHSTRKCSLQSSEGISMILS